MQALLVLAFAIGLHEAGRGALIGDGRARTPPGRGLAAVPLAALAVGCAYAYSFPGLLWLVGAAALWAAVELALVAARTELAGRRGRARSRRGARDGGGGRSSFAWRARRRSAGWPTSRASRPSIPPGRASGTCSTRSPRSRRSASGRRGTFASIPATGRCPRPASTSASCSGSRRSATASPGGFAGGSAPCRRRSPWRRRSTRTRTSRAPRTRRRRRS